MSAPSRGRALVWIVLALAIPCALFVAALNNDFYNATSPPQLSFHIVMRKLYSIGAFALVGYLIARALGECGFPLHGRTVVALGAIYSGAIEVAQFGNGSQEGLAWNLFDIGCGAVGGAISARLPGGSRPARRVTTPRPIGHRTERVAGVGDRRPPTTGRRTGTRD
ncbi:MAG: hypothetical protein NVS2B8_09780 [Vulcanimicrobiaceae bacterium]